MKVPIIYYAEKNNNFIDLVKGIESGLKDQGIEVECINFQKGYRSVSMYKYVIVGYNCISSFGGKISEDFIKKLKGYDMFKGKYCTAFVDQKFGSNKTLDSLMFLLEKEGAVLCASNVISSKESAAVFGRELHIY
jgi:hypothetical protein